MFIGGSGGEKKELFVIIIVVVSNIYFGELFYSFYREWREALSGLICDGCRLHDGDVVFFFPYSFVENCLLARESSSSS
jgi:hypothetical protein